MSLAVEAQSPGTTDAAVVKGSGRFGAGAVSALRAALELRPDAGTLIVDVSEVDAVDERGVGALLGAAHRLAEEGRSLVIRGASSAVRLRLRAVGLHRCAILL